jgi:adenylate kinase family enzyme
MMGPSNSGKSTLAISIGQARGLPPVHLDQLYHLPNTDWKPRPIEDFIYLHNEALLGERWVLDGNYSRCLAQRLERATGLILLDIPAVISLLRYFRRSWFERNRLGSLDGDKDSVKWEMIYHIMVTTPKNRQAYKKMFAATQLPKISLSSANELSRFYRVEGLIFNNENFCAS